uniref:Uncharacterized protein n=1 Tax=Arundo donax TaxID=35708 RepID=A0A0A9GBI9_ARUDO
MATRQLLNALKLSCRTLKHVGGACSSSLSSPTENAYTRLLIDEQVAGDCGAQRNDADDHDADEEEEKEVQEDEVGAELDDLDRLCRMILGRMALKMLCLECFLPAAAAVAVEGLLWAACLAV